MIARRLTLTASTSLCALAALLALTSAPAQALVTHAYSPSVSAKINEGIPAEGPHGETIARPGPLELGFLSMTVDAGHLWTVEGKDRIDEFDAGTGAFLSQLAAAPEGISFSLGNTGTAGIAVGHATGEAAIYVGATVSGKGAVAVYDEAGALKGTWTGAATPAGSFSHQAMEVAVDDSTSPLDEHKGDVYVASETEGTKPGVIDIFRPEADGKEHYVGQITGPSPSEPFESVDRVAVNDLNGDVIAIADNAVDIFEPDGLGGFVLAHKIIGPAGGSFHNPFNLSVDGASGEIYIDDYLGFEGLGAVVDQFSSTGAYLGRITGEDTPHGLIGDVFAVAVDSASHNIYVGDVGFEEMDVFGPDIVFPEVSSEPASSVGPFDATLNGTVNPESAGAATCRFEWGTSTLLGKVAPCEPEAVADGASPVAVHAALSGLQPDTTYFYRLQASNANGTNPGEGSQDQEFTTSGPGIREASVTDLASTSVTFDARIDPHGVPASYYFQYGTTTAYGSDVPAAPGEAIGSGEGEADVTPYHVQGLQADTVYHYRIVVVSEPKPGEFAVFDSPDQTFTTQTATVSELPDGRQWEMVSPPDKQGARIYPIWETGIVQAAAGGDAMVYLADLPTETQPQGYSNKVQVLSMRGPEGWTTRDIALPHSSATGKSIGQGEEYRFFSGDLSLAAVQPAGNFVAGLSAEASESTAMLRTLSTSCSSSSCYRPLVTSKPGFANVSSGTIFGGELEGQCESLYCGPQFIDGTSDLSHVVFASSALDSSKGDSPFEWSNGTLAPLGVLPDGSAAERWSLGSGDDFRGAISGDGSRVVLNGGSGQIYMRDVVLPKTVQLNVAEPACAALGKCKSGGGTFQLASADGTKVVFTDTQRLTGQSSESGEDLYECEMVEVAGALECKLADLAGKAFGVVGASEDLSYLYFVAESALAQGAVAGEPNLYVRHGGVTKLVTVLSGKDSHDWSQDLGQLSARVSPDGAWVEFMSQRSLTGYDNRDAISGKPDAEAYLYDAATGHVICASCDPTGARPTGAEYSNLEPGNGGLTGGPRGVWNPNGWVAATVPGWIQSRNGDSASQPRYLSDSGRLFFNSGDALAPQDVNGTQDVYEWEPPGVGGCSAASATFSGVSGGCVGLISSGTSAEESGFLETSEDGGDVFFLTFSKLQPQDYDNALDVYDAHECTSAAPCFPVAVPQPPACSTADACRLAPTPQPAIFGAPSSATFSGAGNIAAGSGGVVTPKSLTRARKLAGALKACRHKPKRERGACKRRARARYGHVKPHGAASRKKGNG
jgi:hypothetical protein